MTIGAFDLDEFLADLRSDEGLDPAMSIAPMPRGGSRRSSRSSLGRTDPSVYVAVGAIPVVVRPDLIDEHQQAIRPPASRSTTSSSSPSPRVRVRRPRREWGGRTLYDASAPAYWQSRSLRCMIRFGSPRHATKLLGGGRGAGSAIEVAKPAEVPSDFGPSTRFSSHRRRRSL